MPDVACMIRPEELAMELSARVSRGTVVRRDEALDRRTTLRVGGKADVWVEPADEPDLAAVWQYCRATGTPLFVLGRGSNLLVRDGGIRGVVVCLAGAYFSRIVVRGDRMECGAGAKLKTLAVEARRQGLGGLEFMEGIPGSVGGALRMNAGAMGAWTFQWVETVRFMDPDGGIHERAGADVGAQYRGCPLFKTHIALGAVFRARPEAEEAIRQRMDANAEKRWQSQPKEASAGCIFKNTATVPAGKLIDELGLKGMRVGGAMVSPVHGNFIVNDGQATAVEVLELIEQIKARARAERQLNLETEVEIVGEDPQ